MRRIAKALGALATAGMLALAVPTSAQAANGVLFINGMPHLDPSGCFDTDRLPLDVLNQTDKLAVILEEPGCQGEATDAVPPGQRVISEFGTSVYIP